jgi:hypothetical protein
MDQMATILATILLQMTPLGRHDERRLPYSIDPQIQHASMTAPAVGDLCCPVVVIEQPTKPLPPLDS